MIKSISYRGPDEKGFFIDDKIALGHSRLSIIDLKTGSQPILNEDKSKVLVYNGEIYNFLELKEILEKSGHQFRTSSDSEVIIHAFEKWGENCLNLFNGMFAFALYDRKRKNLLLARDQFGKKPLYFTIINNQLIFASEPKALFYHPKVKKEINLNALSKYLAYEYVPGKETIYKGIFKIPEGNFLKCQMNIKIQKYWDLEFKKTDFDEEYYKEKLYNLLFEAVKRRLISDVPLGVFLSGGIDSSTIVALMSKIMPRKAIKTFSIGFEEKSFDETKYALKIASYFKTDHHHQNFTSKTLLNTLPEVLEKLDEPFADASILPTYLLSKFTKEYVTVALGGDGGDELFCGYPTFVAHKLASYYLKIPKTIQKNLIEAIVLNLPVSTSDFSFDFKAKQFLKGIYHPLDLRHQIWLGSFSPSEQKELFQENLKMDLSKEHIFSDIKKQLSNTSFSDEIEKIIYLYVKFYLQDDILFKVDRASMANALEVRTPFLDKEVVDFVSKIPSLYKLKGFKTKYILKKAMEKDLPHEIINRPKKGFGVPLSLWFKYDLKNILQNEFEKAKIKKEGLFKPEIIQKILNEHFSGKKDNRKKIWTLLMFELWRKRWL